MKRMYGGLVGVLLLVLLLGGCGGGQSNPTGGVTSNIHSNFDTLSTAVAAVGGGMQSSYSLASTSYPSLQSLMLAMDKVENLFISYAEAATLSNTLYSTTDGNGSNGGGTGTCDIHGEPNGLDSDPFYPGALVYCKFRVIGNSPDTVQGAFIQAKGILCQFEKAGTSYDGIQHNLNLALTTDCFPSAMIANRSGPA